MKGVTMKPKLSTSVLPPFPMRIVYGVHSVDMKIPDVKADDYNTAALIAGRKLYGMGVFVQRVLGDFEDMCGYFQAYLTKRSGETIPVGKPFFIVKRDVQPQPPERFTIFRNGIYTKDEVLKNVGN